MNLSYKYINRKNFFRWISSSISYHDENKKIIKSTRLKPFTKLPPAKYGGRHVVTMLPGHGIGPEMMGYVRDIFSFINVPIDFEIINQFETSTDVKYCITSIKRNGCCILGIIERKRRPAAEQLYNSPNIAIRKKLDLYAYLNICKSFKHVPCKYPSLDIVIIRQNTEGEFSMMEHESRRGIIESLKICTRYNSERIAEWAFRFAKYYRRQKITIVHKSDVLRLSDGLFLDSIKTIAAKYPEIIVDDMRIDKCTMNMVMNPTQFDILLCPNLYGAVMLNLVCGIIRGAGTISGSNYGDGYAAFETATRSSGRSFMGLNKANPIAVLNAGVNLLHYLNLHSFGSLLSEAIRRTIERDHVATFDLGGGNSTTDVIKRIKYNIAAIDNERHIIE